MTHEVYKRNLMFFHMIFHSHPSTYFMWKYILKKGLTEIDYLVKFCKTIFTFYIRKNTSKKLFIQTSFTCGPTTNTFFKTKHKHFSIHNTLSRKFLPTSYKNVLKTHSVCPNMNNNKWRFPLLLIK
jgi:hypothetical protein